MRIELKTEWDTASTSTLSLRNSLKLHIPNARSKVNGKGKKGTRKGTNSVLVLRQHIVVAALPPKMRISCQVL
jgi:hypothetical protein